MTHGAQDNELFTEAGTLDLLVSSVDILILVVTALMLAYAVYRGFLRSGNRLPRGACIVAAGVVLAVIAQSADIVHQTYWPHIHLQLVSSTYSMPLLVWILSRLAFALIAIGLLIGVVNRFRTDKELQAKKAELDRLRISGQHADEGYRYLFNSTSNSVYCFEFNPPMPVELSVERQVARSYDAVLTECNHAFAHELEAEEPSEVLGRTLGSLDSSLDTEAHSAFFESFVKNDYQLSNYELKYSTPDGEHRVLFVNLVGVVQDGLLKRMWAVEDNVSELRKSAREIQRRRNFLDLMVDVSSQLLASTDETADEVVDQNMVRLADFIGAERATIFWLDEMRKGNVSASFFWSKEGPNPHDKPISMKQYPAIWRRLRNKNRVRVDSVAKLPEAFARDRESLRKIGAKAILVLPLLDDGELVGGLTFGRLGDERPWTDDNVQCAVVFAELLANFLMRLRSHRALKDALAGLRAATDRLVAENLYLQEEVRLEHGFDEIIGESPAILHSLRLVEQVADTEMPVLILGETGTGKELIARALHRLSERSRHALVKVNCAALPANLIESELFGHEKGAFTGAQSRKRGRFELADGSTLFLDEIGEIPIELQAKLLRVLQEGEFERLGGTKTIRVDVRIVVATNRDLEMAVRNGDFRSDLYYRINTFPIELAPLRDRDNDIELLALHFVKVHAKRLGKEVQEISAETVRQLRKYRWPGNVRELEGIIQRALISSGGHVVELAEPLVSSELIDSTPRILSTSIVDLKLVERDHIVSVLNDVNWKIAGATGAAEKLGVPPSTLRSKMKKLGIARPR